MKRCPLAASCLGSWLLLAGTFAALPAQADPSFRGPLRLQDVFLPAQLRNQPYPESAVVLESQRWLARLGIDWTSHLAQTDRYLFDAESLTAHLSVRRGVGDGWEVGFDLPYTRRSGGSLDRFVEFVERSVRRQVQERLALPRDQFDGVIQRRDGRIALTFPEQDGFGDLSLRAKRRIEAADRFGLDAALSLSLSLPTGRRGFGGKGVGPGVGLHLQRPYERHAIFGGVALTATTRPREQEFRFRNARATAYAGLEWALYDPFSLVLMYQVYTPLAGSSPPLDEFAHYYAVGVRVRASEELEFELALVENNGFVEHRNSSDVTFQFSVTRRF